MDIVDKIVALFQLVQIHVLGFELDKYRQQGSVSLGLSDNSYVTFWLLYFKIFQIALRKRTF